MFIVRYPNVKFLKVIRTQRLRFINLSCCINQINEEKQRRKKIILLKKNSKYLRRQIINQRNVYDI